MQKQELSKKEKMSLAVDSEIRELTLFNERGTEIKNAKVEKNESKHLVNYIPNNIPEDCLEKCKGVTFSGIVRILTSDGAGFSSQLFNLEVKIDLEYENDNFRTINYDSCICNKIYITNLV